MCVHFYERLAGPFLTYVDSFDSFQLCTDSDGLTFLNSFSLCVTIPAVDIVKLCALLI